MFKWLCIKLSECFQAHLTDEEKRGKEAIDQLKKAADEFNKALKNVPSTVSCTVTTKHYSSKYYVSPGYFEIIKVEGSYNTYKVL